MIFEVLSSDDRQRKVLRNVTEYLLAGVKIVCVLDPEEESIRIYQDDKVAELRGVDENFSVPDVLAAFTCLVRRFFE